MSATFDIGHLIMAGLVALIGVVWKSLQTELGRIERQSEDRLKDHDARMNEKLSVIQKQADERREQNQQRWELFEKTLATMTVQIESLQTQLMTKLGAIELKLAQEHPTKQDLLTAIEQKNDRLTRIETELTDLISLSRHNSRPVTTGSTKLRRG